MTMKNNVIFISSWSIETLPNEELVLAGCFGKSYPLEAGPTRKHRQSMHTLFERAHFRRNPRTNLDSPFAR